MKKSTSFHRINNDKGIGYFKKLLWYIFNFLSNYYKPNAISPKLTVKKYICDELNNKWDDPNLYIDSSPQRKLSDLFIADFPWDYYKKILNGLNIMDVGCGSGSYGKRINSYSGLDSYFGVDYKTRENWSIIKKELPNFNFKKLDVENIEGKIPLGTNLFFSISAIEHFDYDLKYFNDIKEFIRKTNRKVLQLHFFPSSECLRLQLFHGVRQYNPRKVSLITDLFYPNSKATLYSLGGSNCNQVYFEYITNPMFGITSILKRKLIKRSILNGELIYDRRDSEPHNYNKKLFNGIKKDMEKPSIIDSTFYSLVIESNFEK